MARDKKKTAEADINISNWRSDSTLKSKRMKKVVSDLRLTITTHAMTLTIFNFAIFESDATID